MEALQEETPEGDELKGELYYVFRAILWMVISSPEEQEPSMSVVFNLLTTYFPEAMNVICESQVLIFVQEIGMNSRIEISSDINLVTYEGQGKLKGPVAIRKIVSDNISYKQVLLQDHWDDVVKQRAILNHTAMIEMVKSSTSNEAHSGDRLSSYKSSYHVIMARCCLLEVLRVLQKLSGLYYFHMTRHDLRSYYGAQYPTAYAMRQWFEHLSECVKEMEEGLSQLHKDVLSYGSVLYHAMHPSARAEARVIFLDMIDELQVRFRSRCIQSQIAK